MKSMGYGMKTKSTSSLQDTKKPPLRGGWGLLHICNLTCFAEFPTEIIKVRRICQSTNEQKEKKEPKKKKKLRKQRSAFYCFGCLERLSSPPHLANASLAK
jgi:hypothetical protein